MNQPVESKCYKNYYQPSEASFKTISPEIKNRKKPQENM